MTAAPPLDRPADPQPDRKPRPISRRPTGGDLYFRYALTGTGAFVLVIMGAIGIFLGYQLPGTINRYGWDFLTSSGFDPVANKFGIFSSIVGTVVIAVIALVIAVPFALCLALYITEYAPRWLKTPMISFVDLMAAVPSLIFGAWGLFQLMPQMQPIARWLDVYFGWIPIFHVPGVDAGAANYQQSRFVQSPLVAGAVVAMMVIPLATSVMRNVFDQAPVGEREGALALGSTRWGVIRSVVLPFGRGGMIGGIMLGLGRALGETIAVLFILQQLFPLKLNINGNGGISISYLVANNFGDATPGVQLNALIATGFVLFLMTLVVNTGAAVVVARSRSGAGLD